MSTMRSRLMQIIVELDEKYNVHLSSSSVMLLHSDKWVSEVIGLPVYLPIKVKVATGLAKTDDVAAFQHWKQQQDKICDSFCNQKFTPYKGLCSMRQKPYQVLDRIEYTTCIMRPIATDDPVAKCVNISLSVTRLRCAKRQTRSKCCSATC